jgi:hypothetical protein
LSALCTEAFNFTTCVPSRSLPQTPGARLFSRAVDATTKLSTVRIRNSSTNKVSPLREQSIRTGSALTGLYSEQGRLLSHPYPHTTVVSVYSLQRSRKHLPKLDSTIDISSHGDRATIEHPTFDQMLRLWCRDSNLGHGRASLSFATERRGSVTKTQDANRITDHITLDGPATKFPAAYQAGLGQTIYETKQESSASYRSFCSE